MRIILGLTLAAFLANPAGACSLASVAGGNEVVVPNKVDANRISQAILAHANLARCKNNRSEMTFSAKLTKASDGHARWMAKSRKLSHTSTKAGRKSPGDRLKRSGAKYRTGAENILVTPRMAIPQGQKVGIKNLKKCQFTYKGNAVPARTYDSLGKETVRLWMNSKAHRKNLLHRKFKQMGASVAFDGKAPMCGQFFAAQMFTD